MRRLVLALVLVVGGTLLTPLGASAATSPARIVNCPAIGCFSPNPIQIKAGDTVTWRNNASVPHTATSDSGAWDAGTIAPGATSNPIAFPTVGTFTYHCAIHPSMVASITVSAVAPAATSGPGQLAQGGGGPQFPIGAGLLLLGLGLLAARGVRRYRTQRVGERVDKLPHE